MCFKDGLWQLPYTCFKVAPPGNEIKSRVSFLCVKFLLSAWAVAELWWARGLPVWSREDLLGLVWALTSCLFSALSRAAGMDREQSLVAQMSSLPHASCYKVCHSYYICFPKRETWFSVRLLLFLVWSLLFSFCLQWSVTSIYVAA